nr:MAG TPA: hypothetical protein [Caudoviricetes sp.]
MIAVTTFGSRPRSTSLIVVFPHPTFLASHRWLIPRYSLYSFTLFPISCYHHIIKCRLCVLFGLKSVRFPLFLDFHAFIWYTARSRPRE